MKIDTIRNLREDGVTNRDPTVRIFPLLPKNAGYFYNNRHQHHHHLNLHSLDIYFLIGITITTLVRQYFLSFLIWWHSHVSKSYLRHKNYVNTTWYLCVKTQSCAAFVVIDNNSTFIDIIFIHHHKLSLHNGIHTCVSTIIVVYNSCKPYLSDFCHRCRCVHIWQACCVIRKFPSPHCLVGHEMHLSVGVSNTLNTIQFTLL